MSDPAIILVAPQLGENIGTAARAMFNFGLDDLRLVAPRDAWPSARAQAAAVGAKTVLDRAQVFETTKDAVADLNYLLATTVRSRDMVKPVLTPEHAARELRREAAEGMRAGLLFGPERTGLNNDDVVLADAILSVPVNPEFGSLNLAQAVLIASYEWFKAADQTAPEVLELTHTRPANRDELIALFEHLESELDRTGFLYPPEKRPAMVRNIRNFFGRARLTEQDIRTLRGMIATLAAPRPRGGRRKSKGEEN